MIRGRTLRYIPGYAIGFLIFPILIPYGLISAARALDDSMFVRIPSVPVVRFFLAAVLFLVGAAFAVSSLVVQNTRGEGGPVEFAGIEISPMTRRLVVTGPYRYTRNPMLFGTCALYYAVAVLMESLVDIALVTAFMVLMLIAVKRTEEGRLLRDFGSEYEEYRRRVPMFVPWPRRRLARRGGRPGPPAPPVTG